ncbi:hypothetical protein JZU69_01930, partial [bacterium]|nr:hypothetical protein [bacterium]
NSSNPVALPESEPKTSPQHPIDPVISQIALPVESSLTDGDGNPSPLLITSPAPSLSSMSLPEWLGSITFFNSFTGQYVVPCPLKEAALVEKTREAAIRNGTSTIGQMRSKSHVTAALFAMMDVDGLSEEDFLAALEKMKADGITVLGYTTHSYGDPDKPGIRARLAIPIDRAVGIEEYRAVWKGIDNRYFNGAAGKADSSGRNLYQQQGTWCCHPDRVDQAQSWRHDGGVASADVLIELGGGVELPKPVKASSVKNLVSNNGTYL